MDGKSVVPLIVDPADPATPPSTQRHLAEHADAASTAANWRAFHFIEYYSLGSVRRSQDLPIPNPVPFHSSINDSSMLLHCMHLCVTITTPSITFCSLSHPGRRGPGTWWTYARAFSLARPPARPCLLAYLLACSPR